MIKPNYFNLRAQLHYYAAKKVEEYSAYCRIDRKTDEGRRLYQELDALHKKETDGTGKLAVESKDLTKARLNGKSPDRADAFILRAALDLASRTRGRRKSTSG